MPDFLKVHSIAFYIELSSKYVGVEVTFGLQKENKSGDPQFLFFFLKGYIKVYEIKQNFEIVNARFFNIQFNLKIVFLILGNYQNISFSILHCLGKQIIFHFSYKAWCRE